MFLYPAYLTVFRPFIRLPLSFTDHGTLISNPSHSHFDLHLDCFSLSNGACNTIVVSLKHVFTNLLITCIAVFVDLLWSSSRGSTLYTVQVVVKSDASRHCQGHDNTRCNQLFYFELPYFQKFNTRSAPPATPVFETFLSIIAVSVSCWRHSLLRTETKEVGFNPSCSSDFFLIFHKSFHHCKTSSAWRSFLPWNLSSLFRLLELEKEQKNLI